MEIKVPPEFKGKRLDLALSIFLGLSRAKAQGIFKKGKVLINGKGAKPSLILKGGEEISFSFPAGENGELKPADIPLDVIFEDQYLAVINKPPGLVVHPGAGRLSNTLVNALLFRFQLHLPGSDNRPGIVHRLDKDTSGLIIVAKDEIALSNLSLQFKERKIKKVYLALVHGVVGPEEGRIEVPLGRSPKDRKMVAPWISGREAITEFIVKKRFSEYTFLELRPHTGRTHQIRVHLSFIGHPVVGDPVYGKPNPWGIKGQLLHAFSLEFFHPISGKRLYFEAPLPDNFLRILECLKN
ncbi:MAG: RluA family pseudouridine synthase [Caldiserica bacterium]|nr:RluA family pseudouridine synthase [Caldisericota bacterium]MDH7562969.1 RluA family pseudouridine synthase [Caldisericota bacterium]